MPLHRLINRVYRFVPLGADQKDRLKEAIYSRAGGLFKWSPNYRLWRRSRVLYQKLEEPGEPTEAQWQRVEARRVEVPPPSRREGDPYVVVPVYQGRAETLACILSVLDADPHVDLIVIDDASPDEGLRDALEAVAARGLITLLHNEQNLGFGPTVNRGMAFDRERDVVLLNSDTCVYGDWLDRLVRAARRPAPEGGVVGTVTPLTNNGELASYPRWVNDNPHRLELEHVELDRLAAEVNAGLAIEVPTGVGFCLYIRRDCLDEIGDFDDRFAAGYGEENEFCLRAAGAGWANVVAADTFVTHFGAVSFGRGRSRQKKMERALELLEERAPTYQQDVQRFIARDTMVTARLRLDAARLRRLARHEKPKRSILMIGHSWGGGVEQHVQHMTRRLEAEGVNVYRLQPHENPLNPAVTLRGPRGRHHRHLLPNAEQIAMNPHFDALLQALRILEIDHVHVHHTGGFGIFAMEWLGLLIESLGCDYDLTLHDYAPICPRLHFNLPDGSYCGEPGLDECERCVAMYSSPNGYQPMWRWRKSWEPLLEKARHVFCPCDDVEQRASRYFPKAHYAVRPHPERRSEGRHHGPRASRGPDDALRVVVPGAIGEQKGFDLLLGCARDAEKRGLPIEFCVVGYTMDDAAAKAAGIEVRGRYRPQHVERVLAEAKCDLAFLPSLTPETYCFTLSSVFDVELFPVVFDMGALAERVRDAGFGEVLPVGLLRDPAAVNDRLLALRAVPAPDGLQDHLRATEPASVLTDYYGLETLGGREAVDGLEAEGDRR